MVFRSAACGLFERLHSDPVQIRREARYVPGLAGGTRTGINQNHVSVTEHRKLQIGAEILLRISENYGKSVEWLLTGRIRPE